MSVSVGGKVYDAVSILAQPNSYDATITPENMQRGMTAVVKGKLVEGTGKAFSFAEYGQSFLELLTDKEGNERYGFYIEAENDVNVIFFSAATGGDTLTQETIFLTNNTEAKKIGVNTSTQGDIYFLRQGSLLCIYLEEIKSIDTLINYFVAKDELI